MISLFIFKSNSRGMKYGIGTYLRELTSALLRFSDVKIFLVSYKNNEYREFTVETISERYFKIFIPDPFHSSLQNRLYDKRYSSAAVKLLSQIVPINEKFVFQMNYIDDLPILRELKQRYTYPIISIVHFAQWQQLFNGNRQKLIGLNLVEPKNNLEYTLSLEREMYCLSDQIVSVTGYMKDFLNEVLGIDPGRIEVIPNGLDFSGYQRISEKDKKILKRKMGFKSNEKIILFSGRVDPCKGIYPLIEAFIEACKHNNDIRLVMIGEGDIQTCLSRISLYNGRITFTSFLPYEKVVEFYKIADIGIVPSIYDHCPYTVLEMIACGLPLIMSRIEGLNEILDDSECLFVKPVFDPDGEISIDHLELSKLILNLAGDEILRKKLADNAFKKLNANHSALCMSDDYKKVLNALEYSKQKSST